MLKTCMLRMVWHTRLALDVSEILSSRFFHQALRCPRRLWFDLHDPYKDETNLTQNSDVVDLPQEFVRTWCEDELFSIFRQTCSKNRHRYAHRHAGKAKRTSFPIKGINAELELLFSSLDAQSIQPSVTSPKNRLWLQVTVKQDNIQAYIDGLHYDAQDDCFDVYHLSYGTKPPEDKDALLKFAFAHIVVSKYCPIRSQLVFGINKNFEGPVKELNLDTLLVPWNITDHVRDLLNSGQEQIEKARKIFFSNAPDDPSSLLGQRCKKPSPCIYMKRCFPENYEKVDSIYHIPRIKAAQLHELREANIISVADTRTTEVVKLSPFQKSHIELVRQGVPVVDWSGIRELIEKVAYPRYFLDFETISIPVVPWNCRPYEHIPFQVSIHYQTESGSPIKHYEYLHLGSETEPTSDPRVNIAQALQTILHSEGSIICHHAAFEASILTLMSNATHTIPAGLRSFLLSIRERLWDLEKAFKQHYRHPGFLGSTSLKRIQPILVPEHSYKNLPGGIRDGMQASLAYKIWMSGQQSSKWVSHTRKHLLEYCSTDTRVMLSVFQHLEDGINTIRLDTVSQT